VISDLLFFHLAALKSLAVPIAIGKASPAFFALRAKKIAAP